MAGLAAAAMEDGECATEGAEGQIAGARKAALGFAWPIGIVRRSLRLRSSTMIQGKTHALAG
jgi:hypothetical protein